jgi:glycosyltransferase involved in cell wall biosynthesis
MKRQRLFQIVASSRGGGATHVLTLAGGLAARGHEVIAAMPLDGGHVEGGDFESVGVGFRPLAAGAGSLMGPVRQLVRAFADVAPDVVHAHGARAALWCRCALAASRSTRVSLVYSMHGFALPFYSPARRWVQGRALRWVGAGTSVVVACCEAERSAVLGAGVAGAARVVAIPNGIDLDPWLALGKDDRRSARERLGAGPDDRVITMVCRLHRPRDFDTLIAAFGEVAREQPSARLWVVGDGPLRGEVEARLEAAGLASQARVWGFRRDVPDFYAASDVCVLTSWGWEGLPISVIEAQAAARPVVVTDAGGSAEGIEPGETGFLVPRRDRRALSAALRRLVEHPAAAVSMGARGRERARSRFAAETMVKRIEEVYAKLATD